MTTMIFIDAPNVGRFRTQENSGSIPEISLEQVWKVADSARKMIKSPAPPVTIKIVLYQFDMDRFSRERNVWYRKITEEFGDGVWVKGPSRTDVDRWLLQRALKWFAKGRSVKF